MANWALPTLTSTYTNFVSELDGRLKDLAYGLDPAITTLTSAPTNSVRWNSALNKWQKFDGTSWNNLSAAYDINVTSATRWTTGRTLAISSDASGTSSSWDGSGNATLTLTLATVNSNVGAFGSATSVPVITVNGKGLITAVGTAALGTLAAQAANSVSITGGAISGTSLTLVQSTTAAPTVEGRMEWDTDNDTLMIGDGTTTKTFAPINVAATLTNKTMSTGCTWSGTAIPVANGGTGAGDAGTARTNLGLGTIATQAANSVSITGGAISATSITLVQSTTAAPTVEGRMEWDTDNDTLMIGDGAGTKTFAPINVAATLTNKTMSTGCVWNGTGLSVAYGGTGAATFTAGGLLVGNGTSAVGIASGAQVVAAIGATAVANATAAVTATHVAGGANGSIPYQTAAGATAQLAAGTTGHVLKTNGASAPSWVDPATLTVGTAGALTTGNAYQMLRLGIGAAPFAWSGYSSIEMSTGGASIFAASSQIGLGLNT